MKERKLQIHTHARTCTHQTEQTGNCHSCEKLYFMCFLHKPQGVLFPRCLSFACVLFVDFSWFPICFDLIQFSLHLLSLLIFSCVMTGPVMFTETLPFFFQKHQKKKGWSSLCSISAECAPWDKVRPVQGFTDFCFMILQVLMCRNPENENYLPKRNNHKITFLNGSHVCLCSKILICFPLFCMEDLYRTESAANAGN